MYKSLVFILLFLFANQAFSFDAKVSVYVFENQGKSTFHYDWLKDRDLELPIPQSSWFDWKCRAYKDIDGAVVRCDRNEEWVEAKAYCREENQLKNNRALRVGRGQSFVTIEAACTKEPDEIPKKKPKKKPVAKKKEVKPTETVPTDSLPLPEIPDIPYTPNAPAPPPPPPPPLPSKVTPPPAEEPAATPAPAAPAPAQPPAEQPEIPPENNLDSGG